MVKTMRGFLIWRNSDRVRSHIARVTPRGSSRRQLEGDEYGVPRYPTLPEFTGSEAEAQTYANLFVLGPMATMLAIKESIPYRNLDPLTIVGLDSASKTIIRTHREQETPPGHVVLDHLEFEAAKNLHTGLEQQGMFAAESAKIALDAMQYYLINQAEPIEESDANGTVA